MAKIAIRTADPSDQEATRGSMKARSLAEAGDWAVTDLVCSAGPRDLPYEERHTGVSIAIVASGSFQYKARAGSGELMTPGSLLLGNAGEAFECAHTHGSGDRCISFFYTPESFDRVAADAGIRQEERTFRVLRIPPLRSLSPLVARACSGLVGSGSTAWEELALRLAVHALRLASRAPHKAVATPPGAVARVTRVVRAIEQFPAERLSISDLARESKLSPYYFLRVFEQLTGVTPHQYILRARLRAAAMRLVAEPAKILEVALDCGFGDVSNFNRTFRAEYGINPRAYRKRARGEC